MTRVALLVLVVAACGDNVLPAGAPLGRAANLTIVAHQDDDLLFMQPDELEAVQSGAGTVNVYVTAGNGTKGVDTAERRGVGLMAAYAQIANADDWSCGWIDLAGHAAQHCRLEAVDLSLVFLNYPDGGKEGEAPSSLLHLWEGAIDGADTIARKPAHYDQAGLIATVAEIITTTAPATIRTLEVAATHGRDHSDHMLVGALTVLAAAQAFTTAELISYRGYNTESEPANVIDPLYARSLDALAHYEACVDGGAPCGEAAPVVDEAHGVWMHRRYAVGFRPRAAGRLRLDGDRCASANSDGSLQLVDCAAAPVWQLTPDGGLHLVESCASAARSTPGWECGGIERCMQALPTGELVVGACGASAFRLDDEGHIWAGILPVPTANMALRHGSCLAESGGRVRAVLCGAGTIGTWTVEPVSVVTPRAALGLVRAGRALVLADYDRDGRADLCELAAGGGIRCAIGRGDGTFEPAVTFGPVLDGAALSLVVGLGAANAGPGYCVRTAAGVACTTADGGSVLWSDAFSDANAVASTDESLVAFDGRLCGIAKLGVVCTEPGVPALGPVLSTWPVPDAWLVIGDLDGDRQPDWVSLAALGPASGLDAERALTTAGVPWGFAHGGATEGISGSVALGDIDGDGRADLCFLADATVRCERSQAHGFGPSLPMLVGAGPLMGVWLGDLDGDGRRDVCAEDSTGIRCALE